MGKHHHLTKPPGMSGALAYHLLYYLYSFAFEIRAIFLKS